MEEILSHQICGFHQYVLTPPVHLNYACWITALIFICSGSTRLTAKSIPPLFSK